MSTTSPEKAALDHLQVAIPAIRDRRRPIDQRWLLNHAAWAGQKTQFYYTDGVSDHYIPAARHRIERFVSRARKQLIPTQEFFEVYPWDERAKDGNGAEKVRAYLLYLLTKVMKARSWVGQLVRSYQLYGRAIVENTVRLVQAPTLITTEGNGRPSITTVTQVWPFSRAVDPFIFYHWPESATTMEEVQLLFEDVMVPYEDYLALAEHLNRDGKTELTPIQKSELGRPEWPLTHQIRLQTQGLTDPENTGRGGERKDAGAQFVALSKVWFKRSGAWWMQWVAWNVTPGPRSVRFSKAPWPEPPYRMALSRQLPGEGYSSAQMDDLQPLQVWLNDQVNMEQDAQMGQMFPPVLINPSAIFREDSLQHRPRAKWIVDPQGVQFPSLPDSTKIGFQAIQAVMGLMDSFSGTNPLSEGQTQRGMPRAGYAISSLIQLAMADITDVSEQIEDEILSPTLSDLWRLGVLYTPTSQRIRLPATMGLPRQDLAVSDLYGDFTFRWVGSLQSQDMQVKAQRMVTFLGILGKVAPIIERNGKKVNWGLLLKRMWREGLGERGAETILEDMSADDALLSLIMREGGGMLGGGGGAGVPGVGMNPGSARDVEGSQARGMSESQIGQQLEGTGTGA